MGDTVPALLPTLSTVRLTVVSLAPPYLPSHAVATRASSCAEDDVAFLDDAAAIVFDEVDRAHCFAALVVVQRWGFKQQRYIYIIHQSGDVWRIESIFAKIVTLAARSVQT